MQGPRRRYERSEAATEPRAVLLEWGGGVGSARAPLDVCKRSRISVRINLRFGDRTLAPTHKGKYTAAI